MTEGSAPEALSAQLAFYAEHIPLLGQTILDVGANVGELSAFFWRESGGTSRVVSVEPLAENVATIAARIAAVGAPPDRWQLAACAASDHDGELALEVAPLGRDAWNSAVRRGPPRGPHRLVPCRRLASIAPAATVVKLDIEGHEYPVLADALPSLPHVHTWALELHAVPEHPLEKTLAKLVAHGYRLLAAGRRASDPHGPWVGAEISPSLTWADVPIAETRPDGSTFQMLHVLALATADRG